MPSAYHKGDLANHSLVLQRGSGTYPVSGYHEQLEDVGKELEVQDGQLGEECGEVVGEAGDDEDVEVDDLEYFQHEQHGIGAFEHEHQQNSQRKPCEPICEGTDRLRGL